MSSNSVPAHYQTLYLCSKYKILISILFAHDGGERIASAPTLNVQPVQQIHTEVGPVLIKAEPDGLLSRYTAIRVLSQTTRPSTQRNLL